MKAIFNDTVIAEAEQDDLIRIEGNWYFPPDSIKKEYFTPTEQTTHCFWKGESNYMTITVDGESFENGAWQYAQPMDGAIERVGKDFTNYVAFYPQIEVSE